MLNEFDNFYDDDEDNIISNCITFTAFWISLTSCVGILLGFLFIALSFFE